MLGPRHEKTILIRPEFMNSTGSLFGGNMMKWADDMAFNAATLLFPKCHFVTKLFGQFDFTSPVAQGDIIKIYSVVESRSTSSCKVLVWSENATTGADVFRTYAIMVSIRNNVKVPIDS
ncbi:MAG TPA: acyl-CoA thioesterase [Chthoniobacterales bacterium]